MASLHPHDQYYTYGNSVYSSHSVSPEAEKMLKNPNGSPGPEAGAIPDGLEVNQGANYSTAPQPYHAPVQHQQHQQQYYDHAPTPQTQYSQTTYTNNTSAVPSPKGNGHGGKGDDTIFGLRKPTFFLMIIALLLLAALIAVAGALGAVVAQKNSQLAELQASPVSSASPSATATAAAVLDLSQPAPTDAPIRRGECPTGSTTPKWEVPGTNITFSKDCGKDYLYNDIGHVPMTNIMECVRLCAAFNLNKQTELGRCNGVVFLYKDDQGNDDPYCWLKYSQNKNDTPAKDFVESAWID